MRDGIAARQELNRRIHTLTYTPEFVKSLPHSGWVSAPYFANADEQVRENTRSSPIPSLALPPPSPALPGHYG